MTEAATPQGAAGEEPSTVERIETLLAAEEEQQEPGADERPDDPEAREPDEGSDEEPEGEGTEDESEGDTEDEPEGEEDDSEDEAEADEEEETLGVEELAQYLGVDENQLEVGDDGELFIRTKVDGEQGRAKLNDLVKSYQLEGHLNKRNMEVAELQKSLEEQKQQQEQRVSTKVQQAEDALRVAWNQLEADFNAVNWEELRQEDPGQYSATRQDLEERKQQIARSFQSVQSHREQEQQKQAEEYNRIVQEQAAKLPELIPEWRDEKVAARENKQVTEYARSLGFSDEEIRGIADARAVVALRKAMKYDRLQGSKPGVTKKVRKASTVSKPGASKSAGEKKGESLRRLRSNVKKTGGKGDSVKNYLLESGIV